MRTTLYLLVCYMGWTVTTAQKDSEIFFVVVILVYSPDEGRWVGWAGKYSHTLSRRRLWP